MADENGIVPREDMRRSGPARTPRLAREEQPTGAIQPGNPMESTQQATAGQMEPLVGYGNQPTQAIPRLEMQQDYVQAQVYTPGYAQPGYPQVAHQQQHLQPTLYPPRKQQRAALWTILAVMVLFLLGGGTTLALAASQRPTNTPTQALQQFCDGYKTLDAQKIYDTLSKSSQAKTSVAEIQRALNAIKSFGSIIKITACKISNVRENGSTATGTMTVVNTASFGSISNSVSVPISVKLVLENNTWKIDTSKANSQFTSPAPTIQHGFLTPTVSSNLSSLQHRAHAGWGG